MLSLNLKGMCRKGTGALPSLFFDKTNVALSTTRKSNYIAITSAGALTITGGTFSINDGAYTTTGTVVEGDTVRLQATSSNQYSTAVNVVLSVAGTEYDTWILTTMAEPVSEPSGDGLPYTLPFTLES